MPPHTVVINMSDFSNIPKWMIDSTTSSTEQNNEVGNIVACYIGAFNKRKFTQKQMGCFMAQAFLLPLEVVEKRLDAVLSCGEEGEEENARNLCVYLAQKGELLAGENTDPCEIIELLKSTYGKTAAFETLLTFPRLLSYWKKADVRDLPRYAKEKAESEKILKECSSVFEVK